MKIIGLTGNIGSGKSTVAGVFSHLGIPVYHADAESKKFLEQPEIIEKIALFGDVLDEENRINRRKLASIVFSNSSLLTRLNNLLHPLVKKDFREWANKLNNYDYIIQEAAIIFESGFADEFDKIIHVSCPEDIAISRVTKRDGVTSEMVLQRAAFQMKEKVKAALSDFIIINDGLHLIVPQILSIHNEILEISS